MTKSHKFIEDNLLFVFRELEGQPAATAEPPPNTMSYLDQLAQIEEFICMAGEYGIAYESMISIIEATPVTLSGKAAVKLLEVALLFGFKTERDVDIDFDRR